MSDVPWSVSVSVLGTPMSPAKTTEPIEMSSWGDQQSGIKSRLSTTYDNKNKNTIFGNNKNHRPKAKKRYS